MPQLLLMRLIEVYSCNTVGKGANRVRGNRNTSEGGQRVRGNRNTEEGRPTWSGGTEILRKGANRVSGNTNNKESRFTGNRITWGLYGVDWVH